MIKFKLNGKIIETEKGESLFEVAVSNGIDIPNMCYLKGYSNHPSCMICVVKDKKTGRLLPSCAISAEEGMDILTDDEEINEARKDALELLLSDHVGECEARCRVACPAFMDIPLMNRLIVEDKAIEALKVVKEEIALPIVLGYVCSAPCENACRRHSVDGTAVSICQLKKFVALEDANSGDVYMPEKAEPINKSVAIIGAGPTGLAAAFHLTKAGFNCIVLDKNKNGGGSLIKENNGKYLPPEIMEQELQLLEEFGVNFKFNTHVDQGHFNKLKEEMDFVLLTSGKFDPSKDEDFGLPMNKRGTGFLTSDSPYSTKEENVFVCGSAIKPISMAIRALAEGKAAAYYIETLVKYGKGAKQHRLFNSMFSKLKSNEIEEYLKESNHDAQIIPEDDLNGFDPEQARVEAERCLRCDCRKPVSCKLRIYADEYGAIQDKSLGGDRKLITKAFHHDEIVYEPEKCIRCSLCVDITEKDEELIGLTHVGRGFDVRIGIPFDESLQNSLSKTALKCAFYCPTGAISKKIVEERMEDDSKLTNKKNEY